MKVFRGMALALLMALLVFAGTNFASAQVVVGPAGANPTYVQYVGGLLMEFGRTPGVTGGGSFAVTFNPVCVNQVLNIQITVGAPFVTNGAGIGGTAPTTASYEGWLTSITTGGFTINSAQQTSVSQAFYWMASCY